MHITVYQNGKPENAQIFYLDPKHLQFWLFRSHVRNRYRNYEIKKFFTADGSEIRDLHVLRDNDILFYALKGEAFKRLSEVTMPAAVVAETAAEGSNELPVPKDSEIIQLNVGGTMFYTSRATVFIGNPGSVLAKMVDEAPRDSSGAFFIDRDPRYFAPILNYFRNGYSGKIIVDQGLNPEGVMQEAKFFQIQAGDTESELLF